MGLWSCTDSSFSIRSAKALRVTSKGSKPRSSSCCLLDEPKPNAACQSVEEDTGIVSVGGGKKGEVTPSVFDMGMFASVFVIDSVCKCCTGGEKALWFRSHRPVRTAAGRGGKRRQPGGEGVRMPEVAVV